MKGPGNRRTWQSASQFEEEESDGGIKEERGVEFLENPSQSSKRFALLSDGDDGNIRHLLIRRVYMSSALIGILDC